jgi:hypothetical protein
MLFVATNYLYGAVLLEKLIVTQLDKTRNTLPFIKIDGSLPCSQGPDTGPHMLYVAASI